MIPVRGVLIIGVCTIGVGAVASFSEFLATFDPDRGRRGRQFEHFVKWFLKNDPEWATQVDEVWLWSEYPRQWGRDCGIDLVFKDKIGGIWAVQAKCYSSGYEITKSDVDKFLSESNRKEINSSPDLHNRSNWLERQTSPGRPGEVCRPLSPNSF